MTRLLTLFLFAALTAFGADVAGKWTARYTSENGPREVTFNFQVAEGKVSGTVMGPHGEMQIKEGKLDGDRISFVVMQEDLKVMISGTVSGDEMKLSGTAGEHNFDLPAKRVKE